MSQENRGKLECEEIFARLSEYLDEELPADVIDCISAHISGCEPCVDFLDSLRQSIALCRAFHTEEVPSRLPEDIREQLRRSYDRMIEFRREGRQT